MCPTILLALICGQSPSEAKIDNAVKSAMKSWQVPGVAVAVVRANEQAYVKAHGLRDGKSNVTTNTIFPLASCSKAFTTVLTANLVAQRKLSWDDPVRKYLPDFRLSDPHATALVSLRDLASHRTGLGAHDLLWYRQPFSVADSIERISHLPLDHPFRSEMHYQNITFRALGLALERSQKLAWEKLLREELLQPIGLGNLALTSAEAAKRPDRATGHRLVAGKIQEVVDYVHPEPDPAGSIHANVQELAKWIQFILADGVVNGVAIVPPEQLRETYTPQVVNPITPGVAALQPETRMMSYGLGWVINDYRGHLVVQHTGLIDGFRVHLTMLPKDGLGIVILANLEGTRMNLALSNTLIDLFLKKPGRDWNEYLGNVFTEAEAKSQLQARRDDLARRPDVAPSIAISSLAGTYHHPAYGNVTISPKGDELEWKWHTWNVRLEHYQGDVFRLRFDDPRLDRLRLVFRVEDNKAKAMNLFGLDFKRTD